MRRDVTPKPEGEHALVGILVHWCQTLLFLFCLLLPSASLQLCVRSGHLALILFLSQFIHRCVFFSLSAVPLHIRSRGLSRLLTFLWPSLYYVGTIRFILTRFTGVTLTTLLSACVCLCACVCFMDLTSLGVNDAWKQTEEFRPLKFP